MNYLAPIPKQFVDQSGVPYSDGTVTAYLHGSTARATLYASATGNALVPNPVVLDSNGSWKAYVRPIVGYDYVVKDKDGNVVFSFENAAVPSGGEACTAMIASEYSDEETYASGTVVIRRGSLYRARVDIEEPEDWDPLHWKETTVAECLPILFECTEPDWPDAGLMYEAVKAGRLAGINRLSFNGETRKIWLLTDIDDRTINPEYHKMEFRVDDDSSCERVLFRSTDLVDWTVSTTSTKLAIRGTVAKDWSSTDVSQYHKGTLRYSNGVLYRCLTDSPSSTWVAAEWTETNIADEMPNVVLDDWLGFEGPVTYNIYTRKFEYGGNVFKGKDCTFTVTQPSAGVQVNFTEHGRYKMDGIVMVDNESFSRSATIARFTLVITYTDTNGSTTKLVECFVDMTNVTRYRLPFSIDFRTTHAPGNVSFAAYEVYDTVDHDNDVQWSDYADVTIEGLGIKRLDATDQHITP